jgi:murein DD-endopeptidase MepM/ murein hydrolase activator NlpD
MRRLALTCCFGLFVAASAQSQDITRRWGNVTATIDTGAAYPGGLVVVDLKSRRYLGTVYGILDGRRCPFFPAGPGLRALIPVPVDFSAGRTSVGIEIRGRRGRQRLSVPITVAAREYPGRVEPIPDTKRALLEGADAVRDGRIVQLKLRTVSRARNWNGAFQPPVAVPPVPSFASRGTFGETPVEEKTDAIFGEYHRGLDYMVPSGTPVSAPAAGVVLHAGRLALTGGTVILDHGQGVISVFYHLSDVQVREGEWIPAGGPLGLSGESGIVDQPQLHWGLYVHGVAVDPRTSARISD